MNLLVIGIGIGHEKDLIIGYRYRFKFFISCIPSCNIWTSDVPLYVYIKRTEDALWSLTYTVRSINIGTSTQF